MSTPIDPQIVQDLLDDLEGQYRDCTPQTRSQLRALHRSLPQGVASSFQSYYPYPLVIDSASSAATVLDVDGNEYIDFGAGLGVTAHGHLAQPVIDAITGQLAKGTHFAAPGALLAKYTAHLCERFGMDQVRLCNSGTEATMGAIRLARAATGRVRVIKIEGAYHGHHDGLLASVKPAIKEAGPDRRPITMSVAEGGSPASLAELTVLPFNDLASAERELASADVAAVIVEPVMCNIGMVIPDDGYLQGLRAACEEAGTLLIFDEVKTGATIAWGGARERFGAEADIYCLGKAIGGGMPIGAFGAARHLMKVVAEGRAPHEGTFSGNPVTVAAGHAALTEVLTRPALRRMTAVNERLCGRLNGVIDRFDLPAHTVSCGAKGALVWTAEPCRNYRDWSRQVDGYLAQAAWLFLALRGVLMAPGADEQWTISAGMDDRHADELVDGITDFAQTLRSYGNWRSGAGEL